MALSLEETQARVLALNSEELPFVYTVSPSGVVGSWRYADVKWAALTAAGTIDSSYELRVALDPETSTWKFDETDSSSEITVHGDSRSGGFGISGGSSTFRGREKKTSFQFGVGTAAKTTDRQGSHEGNTYGWSFSSDEIKQPLIAALESAGWQPAKKGFFGRLFGG